MLNRSVAYDRARTVTCAPCVYVLGGVPPAWKHNVLGCWSAATQVACGARWHPGSWMFAAHQSLAIALQAVTCRALDGCRQRCLRSR